MYKIPANTLFVGKKLVYVPECHSTNSLAADLLQRMDAEEGTVIITDNQTNGRGQRGNTWFSEPLKNLTFSLILKPSFLQPIDQFNLTMAVSLALHDFLTQRIAGTVKVKWPNDILVNDNKVCGILIESALAGNALQYSIIGIGVNVNQQMFGFDKVSSMRNTAGHDFVLADELQILLGYIEARYLQLRSGRIEILKNDYLKVLNGRGEQRKFESASGVFYGKIETVNQSGKLVIDIQGITKAFDLKEIRMLD